MSIFITRLESTGRGPTIAVKDLIDVAGVPTTAGSKAVEAGAGPALRDAACLAGVRAGGARIVGKTNLHELGFGTTGINEAYGTPHNPFDPTLIPGGSSSGSAVAVALGEADVALGSDTGGSIRIPSALCGTTGLKTTYGRVSLDGVYPLAPSLDSVGPMARDVVGVVRAMALLEPGFAPAAAPASTIGRLRLRGVDVDPEIDAAVDTALADAEMTVIDIAIDGWAELAAHASTLLMAESAASNRAILDDPVRRALLGVQVASRFVTARAITPDQIVAARSAQAAWSTQLAEVFGRVDLVALPSVPYFPAPLESAASLAWNGLTVAFNLAGVPALSQPVRGGWIPPSLQLVGRHGDEELLVATGAVVESAAGWTWNE